MHKHKEPSFGALVDSGKSKDEICKLKNLTPEAYDKAHTSLMKIREAKRKAAESQVVEVMIEGHSGLYRMDMESREFRNTENPEHYIPFENVPFKITSFKCPQCSKLIDELHIEGSWEYNFKKNDISPKKIEISCPLCRSVVNKNILKPMLLGGLSL